MEGGEKRRFHAAERGFVEVLERLRLDFSGAESSRR
jgi:hypothetical protein